jgi:hypothetical protein
MNDQHLRPETWARQGPVYLMDSFVSASRP